MPKRRHWARYSKPQTTVPHSLVSSGLQSTVHHDEPRSRNVNDLLAIMRRTSLDVGTVNGAVAGSSSSSPLPAGLVAPGAHAVVTPSVPPEIARILLPEVPVGLPAGGPMLAGGHENGGVLTGGDFAGPAGGPGGLAGGPGGPGGPGGRRRGPAGPAPPPSWLAQSRNAPHAADALSDPSSPSRGTVAGVSTEMPGVSTPERGSLVDVVLRQMVRDWAAQRHLNQYHLPFLQGPLKAAIVSCLSEQGATTAADLRALLLLPPDLAEDDDDDGNDYEPLPSPSALNEDFHYLDLTSAIGQSIQLRELSDLLFSHQSSRKGKEKAEAEQLESWDAAGNLVLPRPLLPSLTHLSLALRPGGTQASWRQLLAFAAHLPTLTHLSLAYWPEPTLTPRAKFATVVSPVSGTRVQYGGTGPYNHSLDDDWAEAILVVRKLSKALYRLEYLDLTGCAAWLCALTARAAHDEVDWVGDWGKVTTLVLKYGGEGDLSTTAAAAAASAEPLAGEVARYINAASEAQMVEQHIRRRRAGRGRFITVVGDWPAELRSSHVT